MVGLMLLLLFTFSMTHHSFMWFYRCFHDTLVRMVRNVNDVNDSHLLSATGTVALFCAISISGASTCLNDSNESNDNHQFPFFLWNILLTLLSCWF